MNFVQLKTNNKNTMKVTIDKTEKVEIEVQLPLFTKDGNRYWKIEENQTIQVCLWSDEIMIKKVDWTMEYPCAYEQITEEQFNQIVTKAKSII
jgi:hypothetical protein